MKSIILLATILMVKFYTLSNAQTIINYHQSDGLANDEVSGGVAIDHNNRKWFGTISGVTMYNDTTFTTYTTSDGLVSDIIFCIAVDNLNRIWVGTDYGVSVFNGTDWDAYTTADGLISNSVYYIAPDIDSTVWFATFSGISHFNGSTFTNYSTANGFPNDLVSYIYVDNNGNKFFGTWSGGFIKYDNSVFTQISTTTHDSLVSDNISALTVDHSNNIWVGTYNGVSVFNSSLVWQHNYTLPLLYNEYVQDIQVDSQGNVWFGIYADYIQQGGVTRYDGTSWTSFSVAQGIADNHVRRIAIDNNDNIWITTSNGVSKIVNPNSIFEKEKIHQTIVYPNPSADYIKIELGNVVKNVDITDISGKVLFSVQNVATGEIDIEKLEAGVYFCRIYDSNSTSFCRFVKQ